MKKFLSIKNLVLVLALVLVATAAIGATKVSAAETASPKKISASNITPTYTAATDSIAVASTGSSFYFVTKKPENAVTVKKDKFTVATTTGAIVLYSPDKNAKTLKVNTNNSFYVTFVSAADIASNAAFEIAPAAFKEIKANPIQSFKAVIDYSKIYYDNSEDLSNCVTATYKDKDGKTQTLTGDKLQYSLDQKEWTTTPTAGAIYDKIRAALTTKCEVYVRVAGATDVRPSKAVKISVKKMAKAPKVTVDNAKGVAKIKNGFAFSNDESAVVVSESGFNVSGSACTVLGIDPTQDASLVLPYSKDGKEELADNYILAAPADYYDAQGKCYATADTTKGITVNTSLYTKTKVSAVDITGYAGEYLAVWKPATSKAPASEVFVLYVPEEQDITIEAVTTSAIAVTGGTFKLNSDVVSAASVSSGVIEYTIVKKSEYDNASRKFTDNDLKWSKYDASKCKLTKSSKYCTYNDTKKKIETKKVEDGEYYILFRAQAKKAKKSDAGLLASGVESFSLTISKSVDTFSVVK